jgi:hypothetical protein
VILELPAGGRFSSTSANVGNLVEQRQTVADFRLGKEEDDSFPNRVHRDSWSSLLQFPALASTRLTRMIIVS